MKLAQNIFNVLHFRTKNSFGDIRPRSFGRFAFSWIWFLIGLTSFRFIDKRDLINSFRKMSTDELAIVYKEGGYSDALPSPVSYAIFDVGYLDRVFSISLKRLEVLFSQSRLLMREGGSVCRYFDWKAAFNCGAFIATGVEIACSFSSSQCSDGRHVVRFFRVERIHPGLIFGFELCSIRTIGLHLARRTWRLNQQCDLTIFGGSQYAFCRDGLVAKTLTNRYRTSYRVRVPRSIIGTSVGFLLVPQISQNGLFDRELRYFESCVEGAFFSCLRENVDSIVVKGRDSIDAEFAISRLNPRIKKLLVNKRINVYLESDVIKSKIIAKSAKNGRTFCFGQGSSLTTLLNCRFPSSASYFRSNRFYPKNNWHQFGRT